MDIYLEELAKTIALHDLDSECRDCAMYYFLTSESEGEDNPNWDYNSRRIPLYNI